MANKVQTPDGLFNTQREAAEFYGITCEGIRYRIAHWDEYEYAGKSDYVRRKPHPKIEVIDLRKRKTDDQFLDDVAELGDFSLGE